MHCRKPGAERSAADLNGILGTGGVRCDWEFKLERGERLEEAMRDPRRGKDIVQAVQEVRAMGAHHFYSAPAFIPQPNNYRACTNCQRRQCMTYLFLHVAMLREQQSHSYNFMHPHA